MAINFTHEVVDKIQGEVPFEWVNDFQNAAPRVEEIIRVLSKQEPPISIEQIVDSMHTEGITHGPFSLIDAIHKALNSR